MECHKGFERCSNDDWMDCPTVHQLSSSAVCAEESVHPSENAHALGYLPILGVFLSSFGDFWWSFTWVVENLKPSKKWMDVVGWDVFTRESPSGWKPNRKDAQRNRKKLLRMGISTALAITIHNFPEGLAGMVAGTTGDRWEIPIVLFFLFGVVWKGVKTAIFHLEL